MVDMNDWIVIPQRGIPRELSADEAYPRLFGLLQDLEKERGRQLTDKQVNALQAFVRSLIDARASIRYYDQ
jgi:hypothetical protein